MHDIQGAAHTTPPGETAPVFAPTLDVVVPVYNEEAVLGRASSGSTPTCRHGFPFSWRITIVDNASTDGTWLAATRLAARPPARHAPSTSTGRVAGCALRTAWTASDAAVVAYMDVDLSTDLDALLPLVAPLVSGHSDLAIGSRLAPGVVGGTRTEA